MTQKQKKKRQRKLDNCQVCKGAHGGVRGNENRLEDVVVCDYCTAPCLGDSELARECRQALKEKNLERALALVQRYRDEAHQRRMDFLAKQSQ